ncbi:MAG: pyruvate kinase [bacterium]|nr:pyruvate kinase [bacterium]
MLDKFTKNVATIGPVTDSEEVIAKLIDAGMNVARFNTKHSSPEWHQERIARVRKVAQEKNVSVGILLDLQGPEIRINLPGEQAFDLIEGETCVFTADEKLDATKKVLIPQNVVDTLQVGNMVLLDDGFCELEVVKKDKNFLTLKALSPCTIKHRKTMNIPGITVDMPSLVPADYEQLDGAAKKDLIDFVGLSFVRNKNDIEFLKKELEKRKIKAQIIAKIETQAALDNLEEIIAASDAVMVARGDLGVEVPYEELAFWQKKIINLCRAAAKPVITATQMLKSMVEQPRPTRAEVSDVANAIYDGTDAVMLSEETTIGKYPVKAVKTQAKIEMFNEHLTHAHFDLPETDNAQEVIATSIDEIVTNNNLPFRAIVCLTNTGRSARLLSRLHPSLPIVAITPDADTYYNLALSYGVLPVLFKEKSVLNMSNAISYLQKEKVLQTGEQVIVMHGTKETTGSTDTISIVKI